MLFQRQLIFFCLPKQTIFIHPLWVFLIVVDVISNCHLTDGPLRFNHIKRAIGDVTQRVLTENLRKLARDGYVTRTVHEEPPLAVTYELTALGQSLVEQLKPFVDWAREVYPQVKEARAQSESES